jgi:hypothetical protein
MLRQKIDDRKQSTSSAGHFDSHGGALVQYGVNFPMQHVQGYTRSHWLPPLGNYSLRITPPAARTTINKTTMKKYTHIAGHFDGHGGGSVQYHAQWRRIMAFLEATGCCHWASICSNNSKGTCQCRFLCYVSFSTCWKRAQNKKMAPNNNRGMACQTDVKHFSTTVGYLVGGVNIAFISLRDWLKLNITLGNIGFQSHLWNNK